MMKSDKKHIFILLITVLSLCFSIVASAGQRGGMSAIKQTETGGNYCYVYERGDLAVNEWKEVWDNWYYFDEEGKSKQNTWAEINGKWYYFDQWSVMLSDTTTPDGYQVGSDGAWIQ